MNEPVMLLEFRTPHSQIEVDWDGEEVDFSEKGDDWDCGWDTVHFPKEHLPALIAALQSLLEEEA